MDVHSPEQRSFNMSRIKGKNTRPEILVRKWLWANGYRYRLHRKNLPGKPDIVFAGRKKVIFVNGCFWHKHNCWNFRWPATNEGFWREKIEGTVKRAIESYAALEALGWGCMVIWECEIKNPEIHQLWIRVKNFLETDCQS